MTDREFASATPADREAIADLWFRAQAARRPGSFVTLRDARTLVTERAAAPGSWFVVARERGAIVAVAYGGPGRSGDGVGKPIRGLLHLSTVAVEPAQWGRGLGSRIVRYALDRAREEGYRRVQLWTHTDNVRAQQLYERLGFVRSGRGKTAQRGESMVQYVHDVAPVAGGARRPL